MRLDFLSSILCDILLPSFGYFDPEAHPERSEILRVLVYISPTTIVKYPSQKLFPHHCNSLFSILHYTINTKIISRTFWKWCWVFKSWSGTIFQWSGENLVFRMTDVMYRRYSRQYLEYVIDINLCKGEDFSSATKRGEKTFRTNFS